MLKRHVETEEKGVRTFFVNGWNKDRETDTRWREYLADKLRLESYSALYEGDSQTWIFFDDAQHAYGENELWHVWVKELHKKKRFRLVYTVSYGSGSTQIDFGGDLTDNFMSSPVLADSDLSLYPTQRLEYGLALTRQESDEYTKQEMLRSSAAIHADDALCELIFTWTCGHIGAIIGLMSIIEDYWVSLSFFSIVKTYLSVHSMMIDPSIIKMIPLLSRLVCLRLSLPTRWRLRSECGTTAFLDEAYPAMITSETALN
jgi:hypothetical protein